MWEYFEKKLLTDAISHSVRCLGVNRVRSSTDKRRLEIFAPWRHIWSWLFIIVCDKIHVKSPFLKENNCSVSNKSKMLNTLTLSQPLIYQGERRVSQRASVSRSLWLSTRWWSRGKSTPRLSKKNVAHWPCLITRLPKNINLNFASEAR